MSKKIAVINDLSGFGRCSLTAAISVISAMGVQPCPLPTAILTAQTGYPDYYCDDYTDKMELFRSYWEKMGQRFDGIYTGFVAGERQILQIFRFLDTFRTQENFLLVDPVMGDNGKTYDLFTPPLLREMRRLALDADIITPNLTELCLLTEQDHGKIARIQDPASLMEKVACLGRELCAQGPRHVIVTGIQFRDEKDTEQMGNLYVTPSESRLFSFPHIGGSYSGTGDLFASCIAAGAARNMDLGRAIQLAGTFLETGLADTVREKIPRNDGINYEKYLSLLIPEEHQQSEKEADPHEI